MAKLKSHMISAQQCYFLIAKSMIGTGILGLARVVSSRARQDAWLSVLLTGIIITLSITIIAFVIRKVQPNNFFSYISYLLGKPLAYIIIGAYGIYCLFTTSLTLGILGDLATTWFLRRTPLYIISFIVVITLVNIVRKELTIVARFNEIIVWSVIPFIILTLLVVPRFSILNLRPVGGAGIKSIIRGIQPSFYSFAGFEMLMIFYPYVTNKNKAVVKYSILTTIFVTLFYTLTVACELAFFGYQEISTILYAPINYLDSLSFPVIERIEIFFSMFWTFSVIGTASIQYICSSICFQSIFNTDSMLPFVYGSAPIILLLSLYPSNSLMLVNISGILPRANVFFGILLPILLLIGWLLKKEKYHENKNS